MANREITIEELMSSSDWAQVFADENYGNVEKVVEVAPPGSAVSTDDVWRSDVAEILAAVNGENDGPDWVGLFRLKDGRYLVAVGGCDYTGWDCQAYNNLTVCATLNDALTFGLDEPQRLRLGLELAPTAKGER